MTPKKIVLCGTIDPTSPKSWSGTHYNLYKHFNEYDLLLDTINYGVEESLKIKFLNKFLYLRPGTRDFFTHKLYMEKFCLLCNQLDLPTNTIFFHVSEYCVPTEVLSKGMHVAYIDATLKGLLQYKKIEKIKLPFYFNHFYKKTLEYLNRLEYVFTMNEWSRKSLIEDYNIKEEKVINIGFGINLEPFSGTKDYTNKKILIVLRRGTEVLKGLDLLLEAFKIVRTNLKDVQLSVVGTTYKPTEGVTYYEDYPRSKTIELFQESCLYVMPALYEPNGITYLEALANKTPIIGLDRFAFPEFCNFGKYGYIVNDANSALLAETISHALSNPNELRHKGESGQIATMNHYNWENVINKIKNQLFLY